MKTKLATMVPPASGLGVWTNARGEIVVQHATGLKVFETQAAANEWQARGRSRGAIDELTAEVEAVRGQVRSATEREIESAKKRGLVFVEESEPEPRTAWNRTGSTQFMAPKSYFDAEDYRRRSQKQRGR